MGFNSEFKGLKMRESLSAAHHMHVSYGPIVMGIARTHTSQMAYCT